jgi:hypothetical protein
VSCCLGRASVLKYDRNLLIAVLFLILSVGSAIYVTTAAFNYLRLYPALDQLTFQVDKLSFIQRSPTYQSSLTAQIGVSNPVGYSGLGLRSVSVTIFFYVQTNRNVTLFSAPDFLIASQKIGSQLGPDSLFTVSLPVGLSSQEADQLAAFNNAHPGQTMAEVNLRVDIVTFLVSVTGSVVFTGTWDVPLLSG